MFWPIISAPAWFQWFKCRKVVDNVHHCYNHSWDLQSMGLKLPVKLIHVLNLSISPQPVTPRNPRGQHAESGPQPLQNPEPAGNQSWWWSCDVMTQNPSTESGQHNKFWANHRAAQKSTTYHSWVCVCVNMQCIPQVMAIFTRGFPHFFRQTQLVIKNIPLWGAGFSNTTVSIGSGICLGAELLLLAAQLMAQ